MIFNTVFECVGQNATINKCVELTSPSGMLQLVGNPAGDIILPQNVYWRILRKQITVKGTWNSSFTHEGSDDWNYIIERLKCNAIAPQNFITHEFGFQELNEALDIMHNKLEDYIKIMMIYK